ncbi:FH2 domain-containing protein 1 [Crotalus tigris]|uniref:FH2 domain-containing protein 1 n=1 Tax=Crotalus tigris TaxID=88082 RepID=UPI00192F8FE4|nr:FH2 domain-containing protein 1 [Crotalus tigris]XP_039221530.1 FH2 domain-containing protein 1 [Crotalus tigris]XP_039221531.1 FH2 domain-containing protein 1 [Crotalus tigris]XP_039221532.1 FH2 domain-containing protein 1 [Crotalus tigris]XP_039221533.1 FH2 domain-containing protein 1 [Crotalus tigris]
MHVMNCVSLVNDKENGAISAEAGLMIGDTSEPEERPPPPPPLPPPCFSIEAGLPSSAGVPPPPPPPPPNLSRSSVSQLLNGHGHLSKKKRIRSFFWKTIPEEQVRGKNNIWTIGAKQDYQIDTKTIEEFFGQQEEPAPLASRSRSLRRSFKDSKQEINILDAKRSMNIGIFLKQFKKSLDSIIEDLHTGRDLYSSETLRELLKLLPETEEVKKLKDFSGDLSKLCQADSFMYMLIQVPNYSLRIEAMVLKKEFSPSCTSLQKNMTIIKMATKELMCCEELHAILHLVLQAGNIMNAGGCAGNAVGFKLSSLLKLADTKANKPGMNLLHFVALEAQKKDKILLTFSEKLHHVHEAARISVESIETELHSLSSKTKSLKDNIRRDTELFRQMEGFLQFAVKELKELDHWKRDLMKEAHALIDFLCEDKETMKLEECFQIFRDFCLRFNKAVKENKEREAQQLQQLQRLKELEDKRRSWVVGDISAFGRSSSENDVGTLTKRGLEEFLPFLQQRPQSPSYRNTSTRRSRHSLGVTAERELFTFLGTSKGEDPNKFNSLPHEHPCPTRPNVAWSQSKEPVDVSFTRLHLDQGSKHKEYSYQFLPSQAQHVEDTSHDNLYSNQERSNDEKYRFNVPCMESSDAVSWDPSMEEHEHISGLCKFDSHETNYIEDSSPIHFVAGMQGLDAQDDRALHSPGITGNPSNRENTNYKTEHSAKMMSYVNEALEPGNDSPISSDGSISGTKTQGPVFFESDFECSLTLDLSEESSPKPGGNKIDNKNGANSSYMNDLQTGDNAIFSNDKSDCSNKPSFPKEKSVRSKDALGPKRNSLKDKTSGNTKSSTASPNHPRPVRTLNSSENASMRKVVPISRSTKPASPSCPKKPETKPASRDTAVVETRLSRRNSVRGIIDAAPKPQYRQSISVEEPKFQHGTSNSSSGYFEKEPLQHKGSFKKPSCKPVRYVPKSKNDETKMCRSLTKSQGPVDANKSTSVIAPKAPAPVPSFARNTVASSSKCAKVDLPSPSRAPPLTRSLSQRLPRMKVTAASDDSNPKENGGSTLKRANSAKIIKRNTDNSELLSVKAESVLREQIITEKSGSLKCKDGSQSTIGKLLNHF